jgi:hypothetical protein
MIPRVWSQEEVLISLLTTTTQRVEILIGAVGYSSEKVTLKLGEFTIFDRGSEELYEIRVMRTSSVSTDFLVSSLKPPQIIRKLSTLNERILWVSDSLGSQRFSEQEANFMRAKLLLFEKRIIEGFATSEEGGRSVHQKVEYLCEALMRQTKTDWFYTVMGVFTSIAMAVGVSAANDDKFWELIKNVLGIPVEVLLGNLIPFQG